MNKRPYMHFRQWIDRLLFVDDGIVAVAKPACMLTHPGGPTPERYTVMHGLRELLGEHVFPLHRLDRPTSGVLLFARNAVMASCYRAVFESNELNKTYLAVVRGWPAEEGLVERALVSPDSGRVQTAQTVFRRLAVAEIEQPIGKFPAGRVALLEVRLTTGRWHQIRRHLNGLSHPVLGDAVHGDTRFNRYAREHLGLERLQLHAFRVEFDDPRGFGRRLFQAPLEEDMAKLFSIFKWPLPLGNR